MNVQIHLHPNLLLQLLLPHKQWHVDHYNLVVYEQCVLVLEIYQ